MVQRMKLESFIAIHVLLHLRVVSAFSFSSPVAFQPTKIPATKTGRGNNAFVKLHSSVNDMIAQIDSEEDDDSRQWDLFNKHHAKGRWRGTWSTYDYIGDEIDSAKASVILRPTNEDADLKDRVIKHEHEIITTIVAADCNTCTDSTQSRVIPVGEYSLGNMRKQRLASCGMVIGPAIMRSGAMSTELVLSYKGNSRVRVIFMHGPSWEEGIEPGSMPPTGLKLFRTMISREKVNVPFPGPTRATEADGKVPYISGKSASFFRPVPPFEWFAKWSGSSWTYGPQMGDKGWSILDMEEADAWHGRPTGDNDNVWNLRLPGGILVQCPRIVYSGEIGLMRLAWMPEGKNEENDGALLRLEAGVSALEPIISPDNEEEMIGFYPPGLSSLRCDTLTKSGELENVSLLERERKMKQKEQQEEPEVSSKAKEAESTNKDPQAVKSESDETMEKKDDDDSGLDAIKAALAEF